MARFHPDAALLTAYAAGSLPEPVMLVVATHLSACAECRAETADLLRVGGHCVASSAPMPVSTACRDRVLKAISGDVPTAAASVDASAAEPSSWPHPLRGDLDRYGADLPWKKRPFGIRLLDLPCAGKSHQCFLLDVEPGRNIPAHTHRGEEMVAVLRGAVIDPNGRFEAGDFIFGDHHVVHEQASDPDAGCVCLVVLRGDVDFRGRFGALLNAVGRVQQLL